MGKVFGFIAKHNLKITAVAVILPLIIQISSIIFTPIIALYEKVPSLSQTYDAVLSIRNPFDKPKVTEEKQFIDNVLAKYKEQNISAEELQDLKFILAELLELQKKTRNKNLIKNIDSAISGIENFNYDAAINVFKAKFESETNFKRKVKYSGLIAMLVSFTNPEQAIKLLRDARKIDRTNFFILNQLGKLYIKYKIYPNAKVIYQDMIRYAKKKRKPDFVAIAYSNLGVIDMAEDNHSLALKHFNLALKTNQKYQNNIGMASQYINIALIYEKIKNNEKACVNYRRARIIYYKNYLDDKADILFKKLQELECI